MKEAEVQNVIAAANHFVNAHAHHVRRLTNYQILPAPIRPEGGLIADLEFDERDILVTSILFPTLSDADRAIIAEMLNARRIIADSDNGERLTLVGYMAAVTALHERLRPTLTEFQNAFFDLKLKCGAKA